MISSNGAIKLTSAEWQLVKEAFGSAAGCSHAAKPVLATAAQVAKAQAG